VAEGARLVRLRDVGAHLGEEGEGIDHPEALRGRIAGFPPDRMLGYAKKLHPGPRVPVLAAQEAPTADVSRTRL